MVFEPEHNRPTKWHVPPANTQFSLTSAQFDRRRAFVVCFIKIVEDHGQRRLIRLDGCLFAGGTCHFEVFCFLFVLFFCCCCFCFCFFCFLFFFVVFFVVSRLICWMDTCQKMFKCDYICLICLIETASSDDCNERRMKANLTWGRGGGRGGGYRNLHNSTLMGMKGRTFCNVQQSRTALIVETDYGFLSYV